MPKHGWFDMQTGGWFAVQTGGLFDANTHLAHVATPIVLGRNGEKESQMFEV